MTTKNSMTKNIKWCTAWRRIFADNSACYCFLYFSKRKYSIINSRFSTYTAIVVRMCCLNYSSLWFIPCCSTIITCITWWSSMNYFKRKLWIFKIVFLPVNENANRVRTMNMIFAIDFILNEYTVWLNFILWWNDVLSLLFQMFLYLRNTFVH